MIRRIITLGIRMPAWPIGIPVTLIHLILMHALLTVIVCMIHLIRMHVFLTIYPSPLIEVACYRQALQVEHANKMVLNIYSAILCASPVHTGLEATGNGVLYCSGSGTSPNVVFYHLMTNTFNRCCITFIMRQSSWVHRVDETQYRVEAWFEGHTVPISLPDPLTSPACYSVPQPATTSYPGT